MLRVRSVRGSGFGEFFTVNKDLALKECKQLAMREEMDFYIEEDGVSIIALVKFFNLGKESFVTTILLEK